MTAARLKECLRILRWRAAELADASGFALAEVNAWLDGHKFPPLAVAAWLEALVKTHRSVPPLHGAESKLSGTPRKACEKDDARRVLAA